MVGWWNVLKPVDLELDSSLNGTQMSMRRQSTHETVVHRLQINNNAFETS